MAYKTMVVGVSASHKDDHTALLALADKLKCRPSSLIWAGIKATLADPPKTAPEGAAPSSGTASGFWTVPETNKTGKMVGVVVREVAKRGDEQEGRNFFRYKTDDEGVADEKSRERAHKQAVRAAEYDMKLCGVKGDVETEALE